MTNQDFLGERRFKPEDNCPLFSLRLENHLVDVINGIVPNRGNFCAYCFSPMGLLDVLCVECQFDSTSAERLDQVPEEIVRAMKNQRSIESRWVNSFAYLGVLIAVVGGIAFVLATPIFDDRLIYATIAYGLILLIGSRILAGFLGGYFGDQIGYSKGRTQTIKAWDAYRSKNQISSQ